MRIGVIAPGFDWGDVFREVPLDWSVYREGKA
jgi:hypothetical protein